MCTCADGASWQAAAAEGVSVVLGDRVEWRGGSAEQTDTRLIISSFAVCIDKGNALGMGGIGLPGNPLGVCCHRGAVGVLRVTAGGSKASPG